MDDGHTRDRVTVALPVSRINRYVDKACETSRCLIEAEDVYYAGHVVECAVETAHGDRYTFLAFVLQTSAISGAPHEVKVAVCRSEADQASRTCKAGNYKCKHIVAVLLHINAARTFEQLSPTDQPQKWGKVQKERVMEKYEPRMMVDLPCAKKVKAKETPQLQGHVLERLLKDVGHRSAAKMHFEAAVEAAVEATMDFDTTSEPGPRDLTLMGSLDELSKLAGSSGKRLQLQDVLQHLHESKSAKDVKEIQFSTREQQKSNLWMRHRVGMITASIAYSVYTRVKTLRTRMGPHDVRPLLKKIMRQTNVRTPSMRHGSETEGTAKECFKTKYAGHGNLVVRECGQHVMEGRPYIGASPDGLVEFICCPKRILEVKCLEIMNKFLQENMEKTKDNVSGENLKRMTTCFCQVQMQMGLAGVKHGDLFVYVSEHDNVCIKVEFDEDYFQDVVERASSFFEKYVLPRMLSV
ncbi:uncharacterized protein LOC115326830 [Ixodes scapularis]|uniref:uncharacterized protein LOC115326830 n=1 Tax=Ixodes scapularis TaxID=6945 RepID=UPI001A9E87EF|nr:uncharacterized protein LOC115326830 [Ixodes scapularis]